MGDWRSVSVSRSRSPIAASWAATFILAPEHAPEWAHDRAALWNAAETRETRANSVTAREWERALPSEISADERSRIARAFDAVLVERYGVVADVGLRLGNPLQETLVGRRVGQLAFGVYASVARADAGVAADLARNDWIGFGSGHAPLRRVLAEWLPGLRSQFRTNSIAAAMAAARAGIGLSTLPCAIADPDPGLVRIAPFPHDFGLDLWLLTHEGLRHTARIRAFVDFGAEALAAQADLLERRRPYTRKTAEA